MVQSSYDFDYSGKSNKRVVKASMIVQEIILHIAKNLDQMCLFSMRRRRNRIRQYLRDTDRHINLLEKEKLSNDFRKVFKKFREVYQGMKRGGYTSLDWAEKVMTWANILQHRAQLV